MWILIRKYSAGFLLVVISLIDAQILTSQPAVNAYQRIYKVKKEKMTKFLELDDKTAEEFFEMYSTAFKQIEIKNDELGLAIKKLSFSLDNDNDGEIGQRIKEVQNYQKEIADLAFAVSENAEKILDEKQYARFLIFERRFKHELRKFFQRKQGKGRGPGNMRDK